LLGKQFERRAVIDGADARIAAAKGLIAAGIGEASDVDAITRAFRERGVQRRGEDAALIWGRVPGRQGRDRIALTTTLDVREEQTVLEITAIDAAGLTLKNIAGREGGVAWETLRDESGGRIQLAYGDALTTNTAQGTTVTEHIHAMPRGSKLVSAFGVYTSGSRHREQSFIVTSEGAERAKIIGRRPLGDQREIRRGDLLNNVVRNFAQQPEKEAALALIERAAGLRRGAVQAAQMIYQAAEARGAARESQSMLLERLMSHRIARAFEEKLPGLVEQLRRHGGALARVARIGADMAERLASVARRQLVSRQSDVEFWRQVGQRAEPVPDRVDQRQQTKRHGR